MGVTGQWNSLTGDCKPWLGEPQRKKSEIEKDIFPLSDLVER